MHCPSCGHRNREGARFCAECAKPLVAAVTVSVVWHSESAGEGERKQVTVLFADVIGSMELAERSDPEEWRRIMDRFFSILCETLASLALARVLGSNGPAG